MATYISLCYNIKEVIRLTTKTCNKCKKEYPATVEYFHRSKKSKDGLVNDCKKCACERARLWRLANLERAKANSKRWNELNPGKSAERAKKWRQENPERCKQLYKRWYENNKERHKANRRKWYKQNRSRHYRNKLEWYKNNPEKGKNISRRAAKRYRMRNPGKIKEWQQNNPELIRMYCQQYRARKRKLPSTFTPEDWKRCKEFFNHSCAYCEKTLKRLQQDHFIPVSKGGPYTVTNIIPACKSCNSSKQNHDFFDWYPKQPFYSKTREAKILKYLNYDK